MSVKEYKTVNIETSVEFIEKKSRFIGYIKPVNTSQSALEFIQSIKSTHYNATHNVYAYIIKDEGVVRYSDDGEPTGTAGIPTLDVLQKSNLTDVVVVVTRYFGGILLGGGGLVRAYSHTAKLAVDDAQIITMQMCPICSIECSYNQYGKIASLIPECNGVVEDTIFTDNVTIKFNISYENLKLLNKDLQEITCGDIQAKICDEKFIKIK